MATVRKLKEQKCLHIEAKGCIVNIRENLTDMKGRNITHIEILVDKYAGERPWKLIGSCNNRVIQLKHKRKI